MRDRLKEIKSEVWQRAEEIKKLKKEIKELHAEADMIIGYKRMEREGQKSKKER